ncbi:glutathione S-transferase family protein [Sagittula stellata]|uniref:Glutathione S-transferase family protein n=1 Tax=Sagittula stellata (strain ATCC 700073 / DSM 11524 / E-37) TaxID=388399 RepID=A3JX95_SAGS3|nr:glutathione S-transferase family protein [Sagittula stellata]EBA10131.1 glutathione S-transferase family protein [Sagittula stellata E-37]
MAGVVIHGRKTSSNVQAVMWGAAELGLKVDRRDVGGRFGGTDTAAFRAMNPMGLVPVLEDGSHTLFESAVILRYLVASHGPGPIAEGPEQDMWAEWAKYTMCAAFTMPVFWGYYRTPEADRDMPAVLGALERFEELAGVAMARRGAGPWLVDGQFSRADIMAGHVLYRYFTLDLPRKPPAGLEDYYAALVERPAYREHVMVDYSELKG